MTLKEYINYWNKDDYLPYEELLAVLKQDGWEDITNEIKQGAETCPVDDPADFATVCEDREVCGEVRVCNKGLVYVFRLPKVYVRHEEAYQDFILSVSKETPDSEEEDPALYWCLDQQDHEEHVHYISVFYGDHFFWEPRCIVEIRKKITEICEVPEYTAPVYNVTSKETK